MSRRAVSMVFQNTNHDGTVTQRGDIIGTCELNKKTLLSKFPDKEHYLPERDRNLSLSWNTDKFKESEKRYMLVHGGDDDIPTPHRGIVRVKGQLYGNPTTLLVWWPVNSAFKKGTNHPVQRRNLWNLMFREVEYQCQVALRNGDIVIGMTDGNRPGHWLPHPAMKEVVGHGPSRIFINKEHKSLPGIEHTAIGPETGKAGDVHHHSLKATIVIRDRRGRD